MRLVDSPIFRFFGFCALLLAFFLSLPLFTPLLIAGVITQGILGGFSGKVGPVVGGKWKEIDYMKSYVIPANPQTVDQTTQRTRFSTILGYARQVLSTLIQPYWDPYYSDKSGYNAIMSDWLLNADASDLLVSACKISKGTLVPQVITTAQYNTGTGVLTIDWAENTTGNALSTDVLKAVVFDKSTGLLYFDNSAAVRSGETDDITIASGLTATNLEVFTFFVQGSGSSMIVSDSDHITAAAP